MKINNKQAGRKRQSLSLVGNKKGWIKIAEAFIAVILIAAIMLTVYAVPKKTRSNEVILNTEDSILDEIAQNEKLRQDVMDNNVSDINSLVSSRIPGNLNFTIKICSIDDVCGIDIYRKEMYARERIISSSLIEYNPKKLKIFMWEK